MPNQSDALGGRGLARIRTGRVAARGDRRRGRGPARHGRGPAHRRKSVKLKAQALFNAARVYALAVEFAAQEVSRQGERAIALYRNYRSRALDLLDEALKQVPDQDDRDAILNDPALRSLRRGSSRSPGLRFSSLSQDRNARLTRSTQSRPRLLSTDHRGRERPIDEPLLSRESLSPLAATSRSASPRPGSSRPGSATGPVLTSWRTEPSCPASW